MNAVPVLDSLIHRFTRPTRGLLFIGDPHLWSRQPGLRRDASFMGTVLGKLEQAADIANEQNLWPVFLGDLLHSKHDHDPEMLIRLTRVLQRFDRKPVTLVGNHDKEDVEGLSERNALLLLGVTGQIELIDHPRVWAVIELEDEKGCARVAVGGTPYGYPVPASFDEAAGGKQLREAWNLDRVVWITHDDFAFGNAYPGAKSMREVEGIDVVVNGHMHGTHKPHAAGSTVWYNPGNITRMSVDLANHVPAVWGWKPQAEGTTPSDEGFDVPALQRFVLRHAPGSEAFSFEGRHAPASMVDAPLAELPRSVFVAELLADRDQTRTDDGVFVSRTLDAITQERSTPEGAKAILVDLRDRALVKHREAA